MSKSFRFLHRASSIEGDALLVETDHVRLRQAVFLDGREQFWSREFLVRFDDLAHADEPEPIDMLLHPGFGGSTLLARLMDNPGAMFVLKEPQALSDLASQQCLSLASDQNLADRSSRVVVGALGGSAAPGERLLVKPSCWANPLLPSLARQGFVGKLSCITIRPEDYLVAAFRGGRDRLAYCIRLAGLFAQYNERQNAALAAAFAADVEPLARAARTVVLLHHWHETLYAELAAILGEGRIRHIPSDDLLREPVAARDQALAHFAPDAALPDPDTTAEVLNRDAKAPERRFVASQEAVRNAAVTREHAELFRSALDWLQERLA